MIDPEKVIGTYVKPGSHNLSDEECKKINGERATYKNHAILFDSYLYHYGPSSSKSIYKLLFTFTSNEESRFDYSIYPEFDDVIVNQSLDELIKELYHH